MSVKLLLSFVLLTILLFAIACTQTNQPVDEIVVSDRIVAKTEAPVQQFEIEAYRWGYEPDLIEVNKGDKVRIIAWTRDVAHSLTLPEFRVNMQLDTRDPEVVEFIADKTGAFEFYCSIPCGRGHGQMRGTLIVK